MMSVRNRQQGFSIIELMTAVTISLIMFAVILQLFASNKQAYRVQEGASVLNENARYAVGHLQYFMRLADHWGGVEPDVVSVDPGVPVALTTGSCDGGANPFVSNSGFRGFDGDGTTPPTDCIAAQNYEPDTDAFFVRYAAGHEDDRTLANVNRLNGIPYIPDAGNAENPIAHDYITDTNGDGIWVRTVLGRRAIIFENVDRDSLPADVYNGSDTAGTTNYRYYAMLYHIRPCSNPEAGGNSTLCDTGHDGVPTLVRQFLNTDGTVTTEDVVAGVEQLQLLYGIDTDEDLVAERYDNEATVQAAGNWDKVVSVRVSVIVANIERDTTLNDTTSYYLQDEIWTPPSEARQFRRSQFDFIVQVRNFSRA